MNWSFAIINGKLAEIYYEKHGKWTKSLGHCYVKKSEYKTKQEQKYIAYDTKKFIYSYSQGKYIPKNLTAPKLTV